MELIAQAVLTEIKAANADLRKALDGLSDEALNWRPLGQDDSSSLYVLASHMIGVQRSMVGLAANKPFQRDRAAEFVSQGADAGPLLDALDEVEGQVEGWLEGVATATLSEPRTMFGRETFAATPLLYCLRHLGEHAGHAGLTRQLWEQARNNRG